MITDERKAELRNQLEYDVQRWIDAQGLVPEALYGYDLTYEERQYLLDECSHSFEVREW